MREVFENLRGSVERLAVSLVTVGGLYLVANIYMGESLDLNWLKDIKWPGESTGCLVGLWTLALLAVFVRGVLRHEIKRKMGKK